MQEMSKKMELQMIENPTEIMMSTIEANLKSPELRKAMLSEAASKELSQRIHNAMHLRTPMNVRYTREGPKNKRTGQPIMLEYVKIGYMQEVMRQHISPTYEFKTITPPQILQTVKGGVPIVHCFLELHISIFGQIVRVIPCQGTCDIQTSQDGSYANLETAMKGAVTDAMKKGFSFIGICNDVYEYGDVIALTPELIEATFEDLQEALHIQFPADRARKVLDYFEKAKTAKGLRAKYWKVFDDYKRMEVRGATQTAAVNAAAGAAAVNQEVQEADIVSENVEETQEGSKTA